MSTGFFYGIYSLMYPASTKLRQFSQARNQCYDFGNVFAESNGEKNRILTQNIATFCNVFRHKKAKIAEKSAHNNDPREGPTTECCKALCDQSLGFLAALRKPQKLGRFKR
jgi:hypothetical protein